MPNWVWQLIVALVVIVGAVIIINALGDAGAFN
jgi:hypothetical protein